jgi:hypothetical protein
MSSEKPFQTTQPPRYNRNGPPNPSTQARDANTLNEAGYVLEKYALADQFPHTGHIESIAKFVRK